MDITARMIDGRRQPDHHHRGADRTGWYLIGSRDDWQAAIAALESHRATLGIRERSDITRLIDHLRHEVTDSHRAWPRMMLDHEAVTLLRRAGVEV